MRDLLTTRREVIGGLGGILAAGSAPHIASAATRGLGLRNAMLSGKKLPYDAEVEYAMASSATGDLMTDIPGTNRRYVFNMDCDIVVGTGPAQEQYLFSAWNSAKCICASYVLFNATMARIGYMANGNKQYSIGGPGRYLCHSEMSDGYQYQKWTKEGVTYENSSRVAYSATTISNFHLQSKNSAGMKIRHIDFSADGVMLLNWKPVRVGEKVGLYNSVTGNVDYLGKFENWVGTNLAGGGYKRKCVRRSYRRSARASARFYAHSHRWEVAA